MSPAVRNFVIVLIINFIIAVIYLVWNILRQKNKNYIVGFIVMLLSPVVGPVFYGAAYLSYKLFFYEPVDLEDVVFSKDRVKSIVRAEEEQERNMVSLEEAIEITNRKDLRTLMMNIVRGDIQKFLYSISLALNSEDSETAHYAASVLQDALNDFRVHVEKQRQLVEEDGPDAMFYAATMIDYMNQVLEQKVFNDMEQKNFVAIMDEVCEKFFARVPEQMTSTRFEAISMRLLEVEDYDRCEIWCQRAKGYFPNMLSTYTCQLKLYFACTNRESFFEVVDELKSSSVVVDSETLELLRVFR